MHVWMQYVVILACMSMHQIDNVSTVNKVLCQYLNFCRKMFSLCLTCLYMLLNICNVIHISTSLTVQYFFLVGVVPFWVIMLSSGRFLFSYNWWNLGCDMLLTWSTQAYRHVCWIFQNTKHLPNYIIVHFQIRNIIILVTCAISLLFA